MNITEHFTIEEFTRSETAVRMHIDNTIPEGVKPNIKALCENVLEPVRAQFGAIRVTSGYRCAALNARVGGAKGSQHCLGEAADIIPIPSCGGRSFDFAQDDNALKGMYVWMMDNLEFDQLILEPSWIHVSYREGRNRQMVIQRKR